MELREARAFAGMSAHVTWTDRNGGELSSQVQVFDVTFVPMYGPCLVTDAGDIKLDRIVHCTAALQSAA